jgi:hypothetical protein
MCVLPLIKAFARADHYLLRYIWSEPGSRFLSAECRRYLAENMKKSSLIILDHFQARVSFAGNKF